MTNILKKIFSQESKVDIYKLISNDDIDGLEKHLKNKGNPNQLDEYGQTPIFRVILNKSTNQFEMLKCLLKHGADINYKRDDGTTPIFYARGENAKFLIENGAYYNQISLHGTTPIFNCFDSETLQYFVSLGLDINAKDNNGRAPLHDFVYFGSELVEIAIKNNADVNILNSEDHTPLICLAMTEDANQEDMPDMILTAKILIDNKANVNHRDKCGHDVYYYCIENQNQELAQWLEKNCPSTTSV